MYPEPMQTTQVKISLITFDAPTKALIALPYSDYSMIIIVAYDTGKTETYSLMYRITPSLILTVDNRPGIIRIIITPSRNPQITTNIPESYVEPPNLPQTFETWISDGTGDTKPGQPYLSYKLWIKDIFTQKLDDIRIWIAIESSIGA